VAIIQWIWPPGRCQNCQSIYSTSLSDITDIKQIHRSDDGRFMMDSDVVDGVLVESKRNSVTGSQYSSSDDGGFLPKRSRISCPTWRRPLVQWPSELSFRSDGQSSNRWIGLGRNLLQTIPQLHRAPIPVTENLHINTVSANVPLISSSNLYTPSRVSRIHASSPATSSSPMVNSPWSPLYFSDLSSVHPSSAERSGQGHVFSPNTNRSLRNIRNPRYVNELPSLRSLHDESRRMTQMGFIPVQIPSPPVKSYYANIGPQFYQPQTTLQNHPIMNYHRSGRSRTFPRMLRAPPELSSPMLNLNLNILEQSPESQSSSSGFGSKNTSSHQNQSSQSGGTSHDWRLPPYRPPPQATTSLPHPSQYTSSYHDSPSSPYTMSQWFELMQRLNLASVSEFKAVDVGSVDGHYEVKLIG
jgi:immunoglobulin superfamily member 9B